MVDPFLSAPLFHIWDSGSAAEVPDTRRKPQETTDVAGMPSAAKQRPAAEYSLPWCRRRIEALRR